MAELYLEIVSPEGKLFSGNVDEVIVPGADGELAILPHHTSLFSKLTEGEVIIKKGPNSEYIAILGGFLEVGNNKITIIADFAVRSESVSQAKAEEAKKKAEKLLAEKASNVDFVEIEKDLQRSILELKIADKVRKRRHS